MGINIIGSGVTSCDKVQGASCYGNGFVEYTLVHSGDVKIRNWRGSTLRASLASGVIEHGKALADESTITNPPSNANLSALGPYMKSDLKGRPIQGNYTLRIWDTPELKWNHVDDIQLVWKYHYWTRGSQSSQGN